MATTDSRMRRNVSRKCDRLEKHKRYNATLQASSIAFDRFLAYDDECFIGRGNPVRGEFLRRWIRLPGGAAFVAVEDGGGRVTGYGCRRPCIDKQPRTHCIGPLYADTPDIAEALLRRLCADVIGQMVVLHFW